MPTTQYDTSGQGPSQGHGPSHLDTTLTHLRTLAYTIPHMSPVRQPDSRRRKRRTKSTFQTNFKSFVVLEVLFCTYTRTHTLVHTHTRVDVRYGYPVSTEITGGTREWTRVRTDLSGERVRGEEGKDKEQQCGYRSRDEGRRTDTEEIPSSGGEEGREGSLQSRLPPSEGKDRVTGRRNGRTRDPTVSGTSESLDKLTYKRSLTHVQRLLLIYSAQAGEGRTPGRGRLPTGKDGPGHPLSRVRSGRPPEETCQECYLGGTTETIHRRGKTYSRTPTPTPDSRHSSSFPATPNLGLHLLCPRRVPRSVLFLRGRGARPGQVERGRRNVFGESTLGSLVYPSPQFWTEGVVRRGVRERRSTRDNPETQGSRRRGLRGSEETGRVSGVPRTPHVSCRRGRGVSATGVLTEDWGLSGPSAPGH